MARQARVDGPDGTLESPSEASVLTHCGKQKELFCLLALHTSLGPQSGGSDLTCRKRTERETVSEVS